VCVYLKLDKSDIRGQQRN